MTHFPYRQITRLRAALLTAGCMLTGSAWAQAGARCEPQSSDAASTNACAVQRFQHAETAQNILYTDVMRALSAHERPALRKDQSAWSRGRTSQCKTQHAADEAVPTGRSATTTA